jgi:hypothetical protein
LYAKWYPATVSEATLSAVHVSYDGWGKQYDEWIPRTSARLARLGENTGHGEVLKDEGTLKVSHGVDWLGVRRPSHSKASYGPKPSAKKSVESSSDTLNSWTAEMAQAGELPTVGSRCDVLDLVNKWCEAEVLQVSDDGQAAIMVHYVGWSNKWDEM